MNRVDLAALLARSIATHARDELLGALLKAQVPAGAGNDIREALATPLAQRMTLTSEIDGKPTRPNPGECIPDRTLLSLSGTLQGILQFDEEELGFLVIQSLTEGHFLSQMLEAETLPRRSRSYR